MKKQKYFVLGIIFISGLLAGCCSSGKTTDFKNTISLPPGNAEVKVLIMEISANTGERNFKAKIEEVTGYGPATPMLAVGSEVEIYLPETSAKNDEIKKDDRLYMRAYYQTAPEENGYWTFIKLIGK